MINLLAPNDKRQLAAARTNTLLLRYVVLMGVFIAALMLEMGATYVVISSEKARNEATIAENDAKTKDFATTKAEAALFKADLATAKSILDKQVGYTKLLTKVANILPTDAVLDKLVLDPATFGTPTALTVHTKSYNSAIDVKQKFQDSGMFSDVNFQSITQTEDQSGYPFNAIYNVTFSKVALAP